MLGLSKHGDDEESNSPEYKVSYMEHQRFLETLLRHNSAVCEDWFCGVNPNRATLSTAWREVQYFSMDLEKNLIPRQGIDLKWVFRLIYYWFDNFNVFIYNIHTLLMFNTFK